MHGRDLHDVRSDGLTPLESLDPAAAGSFAALVRAMSKTAFAGRNLGEAFDVLLAMFRDEGCRVVLTLSVKGRDKAPRTRQLTLPLTKANGRLLIGRE